ncbi:MAG TPA: hypothetical protein VGY48_27875 [Vicinamibacterales bacterium]|jgi:hypothetical protein|nr:hypothetical protein [Vicinamibacterales bacterium]
MDRARLASVVVVVSRLMFVMTTVHAQTAALPEGWVVLPVDEYRALRERAVPPPIPPVTPPVDATLTRVDYDLRIDADTVTGRALLTIDVLRDGWTRVPIPAGLMVREASLDGHRVSLVDAAPPYVLLSHPGRAVLALDVVIPMSAAAGAESIVLPPSASPIVRARLTLPRNGVELALNGGFVAEHSETADESHWTAFGRPNQPLALTWKRKVDDRRAEQPLRVRARITELVGLGEDACQVSAAVRIEVLQGLAHEVSLLVPAGLVVNQVTGSTVADWESAGGTLRVMLLEPTATDASFVVQADARTPREGSVPIPLVRMPSAERETGGVAVEVAGAGEVGEQQVRGLERTDPSELGDIVANRESPSMIAFRHRPIAGSDARTLAVDVVRYTPQAVFIANVEEARYRALVSEDGRLLVEARYAVRNNQRSFLKAVLPQGATLWSAEVAGRPIRPGLATDGSVLLPLEKGRAGDEAPTFVLELVYLQRVSVWTDKSRPRLELPALDLPVSRTGIELHHSPRFRVEPQPGAFRVDSDPGPFAEALRRPQTALTVDMRRRDDRTAGGLQALVDRFKNDSGGRTVAGVLPLHIEFPAFGPSVFLASELTAETRAPAVDLLVRRINN